LIAIVPAEIDDYGNGAARRRCPLVAVVAPGIDDNRRIWRVPVVAACSDRHRAYGRIEPYRLLGEPHRLTALDQNLDKARGRVDKRSRSTVERGGLDRRRQAVKHGRGQTLFVELPDDRISVDRGVTCRRPQQALCFREFRKVGGQQF